MTMTAQWIREHYKVPAKKGGRVRHTNIFNETREGTIIGYQGGYIKIRLDGNKYATLIHPTWRIEYL